MERAAGARIPLFDASQLDAVVEDMARQAAGLLVGCDDLAVIGILRRGAPLADRLCSVLQVRHGCPPPLRADLCITRYADNLRVVHPDTRLVENAELADLDLAGYTVLLVDDVLYCGHSLLKAVDYLAAKQPAAIRAAVLVDRCVATLPVHADVVGLRLHLAPGDIIDCHVPPYEPDFRIEVLRPEEPVNPC
jgi:pyrimidine operon attenuation protein / uracil phosphoribosyltransferase